MWNEKRKKKKKKEHQDDKKFSDVSRTFLKTSWIHEKIEFLKLENTIEEKKKKNKKKLIFNGQ